MPQHFDDPFDNPERLGRRCYPHWLNEQIRWSDTDMAGHANNLAFAAFCEAGRALILKDIIHPDAKNRSLLVVAEFRLRFLSEMHWPDVIDIGTGISAIGNSSCVFAQALFQDGHCVAVADSRLVLIDDNTRQSRPLTTEILNVLARWKLELLKGESAQ
jgi:acyl-CoA thioester hydrolase